MFLSAKLALFLRGLFEKIENSNLKKYYSNLDIKREKLIKNSEKYDLRYLLGIINSLTTKYFLKIFTKGKIDAYPDDWKEIIIPKINSQNKTIHDEIIRLVDQLLKLNEEKAEAKLETKINQLKSKIDYCECRINEIVYQLYGLTEEEIAIVQGN